MTKPKTQKDILRRWRAYPEEFIYDWFGWKPWDKQIQVCHSVRDYKETYVQSGNALGKSHLAAALVIWWVATRRGKVVTTAPTFRQVREILWSKVNSFCLQSPGLGFQPTQTRLEIEPEWYAFGASTNSPDAMQGIHSNVLVVVDEACGVTSEEIWTALDGDLTDGRNDRLLAIGNPTDPDTIFRRRCDSGRKKDNHNRNTIVISAFDCPNVEQKKDIIPGLVSWEWVKQKIEDWGEDSPFTKARIYGEFPENVSDSLFPLAWLNRAFEYDPETYGDVSEGISSIGLDVGAGADNNSLVYRTGGKVWRVVGWPDVDTSNVVLGEGTSNPALYKWIDNYMPQVAIIDALGVGKPIYDYAKKHRKTDAAYRQVRIRPFKASNTPMRLDLYANVKAEAYIHFRERLRLNQVDLSAIDPEMRDTLEKQANAIRGRITAQGRWQIEDKKTMKAREGFSPDELEGIIMAMYGNRVNVLADAHASFEYEHDDTGGMYEDDDLISTYDYNMRY